jgi:hypothetical protein
MLSALRFCGIAMEGCEPSGTWIASPDGDVLARTGADRPIGIESSDAAAVAIGSLAIRCDMLGRFAWPVAIVGPDHEALIGASPSLGSGDTPL